MSEPAEQSPLGRPGIIFDVPRLSALLVAHGYALSVFLLVVVAMYARILEIRPLHADNLSILSWAARSSATSFLWGIPESYPEWRPLAFMTISAQFHLVGLASVESFFAVNLLTWALAACCLYAFVVAATGSHLGGALVALAMLLDLRAVETLKWITGRQTTLMVLFGYSALFLVLYGVGRGRSILRPVALFCLLLASPLSKEFGLAFSVALLVYACIRRDEDSAMLRAVSLSVMAFYGLLRAVLVGGAGGNYCNEMGFFTAAPRICYADLALDDRLLQHAYNVGAALVGTVLPGVLTNSGVIRIEWPTLAISVVWLGVTMVGWIAMPRKTLLMLILIFANALMSFMVYRERNQTLGFMSFYASAGVGFAVLATIATRHAFLRLVPLVFGAVLIAWLVWRVPVVKAVYAREISVMNRQEPCAYVLASKRFDPKLITAIKTRYGMADPDCAGRATPLPK